MDRIAKPILRAARQGGDMRRLIRQYGRSATSVFPTGPWHKGGSYATDVNFPVPQAETNNPNLTGVTNTCIDRNA